MKMRHLVFGVVAAFALSLAGPVVSAGSISQDAQALKAQADSTFTLIRGGRGGGGMGVGGGGMRGGGMRGGGMRGFRGAGFRGGMHGFRGRGFRAGFHGRRGFWRGGRWHRGGWGGACIWPYQWGPWCY